MKKRVLAFLVTIAMAVGIGATVYGGGYLPPVIPCPPEARSIEIPFDTDIPN